MPLLLPRNRLPRTVTLSTWTGVRLNADAEVSPEMSQSMRLSSPLPECAMPFVPVPFRFTTTRLRSVTFTSPEMSSAFPPAATTLPTAPGTASSVTDFVIATGPML
jgi:hypothetical protein